MREKLERRQRRRRKKTTAMRTVTAAPVKRTEIASTHLVSVMVSACRNMQWCDLFVLNSIRLLSIFMGVISLLAFMEFLLEEGREEGGVLHSFKVVYCSV